MPTPTEFAAAEALLAPWRVLTDPRIDGYGNLPDDGRYLLVANHTTLGVFDVPFLVLGIHRRTGVLVRSLGERAHFRVPVWRDMLHRFGTIDGSREATRQLMRDGEAILVFPGGGREVARRREDHYPLVWRERIGFARLALEAGYPIVPVSMIGVDDMWDVVVDNEDPLLRPVRALAERLDLDPELVWPVVRGLGPTPLPRPQRIYGRIGEPIDAREFGTAWDDAAGAKRLSDATSTAIRRGIDDLLAERREDPARDLVPRLRGEVRRLTRAQVTAARHLLDSLPRP